MNVFISHNHKDKDVVRRLAEDLKRHEISVWLDENIISPGEPWAEKLSYAVEKSDAVLVIISRNTSASQWQASEIAFAIAAQKRDESKRVIPVLVDKGAEVPFFLKSLLYCDLSDDSAYQRNFTQLLQAIEKPTVQIFRSEDLDKLRIERLKAEQLLLVQEKEVQSRKKAVWMTSVLGALASVIAASMTLFVGVLGNIAWGHRTVDFIIGAIVGVLASVMAFSASRMLHKRSHSAEGTNANK